MNKQFSFPQWATPIHDCSGLIPHWVCHLNDLNRVEAENILKAQRKYLRSPVSHPKLWFQVEQLKKIHRAMFGDVWDWAGAYRKSITSIGIRAGLIPSQLAEFCIEVLSWTQYPVELTVVEMAARIHHRLVYIHPFENGNGRFSRLVADRFLLAFRCPYPIWPSDLHQEGCSRKSYIHTLQLADKGDYGPLIAFMQKLGAQDPQLTALTKSPFYKVFLSEPQRIALLRALLRNQDNPNHPPSHE